MRQIKFRVWDPKRKVIEDVGAIDWGADLVPITCHTLTKKLYWMNPEDYTLLQFTGLLDKNGKEIYEGDIVEGNPFGYKRLDKAEVKWDDECCQPFNGSCGCCQDKTWSLENTEVIGNVYENPDLLN